MTISDYIKALSNEQKQREESLKVLANTITFIDKINRQRGL